MRFDFVLPVMPYDADVRFYAGLARHLQSQGQTVAVVALSREAARRMREHCPHVHYLYEAYDPKAPCSQAQMAALEHKYRMNLADEVFTEHGYGGTPVDELIHRMVFVCGWMERFLAENEVRYFINNAGGELIRRVMTLEAKIGGPANIRLEFTPFHGRMTLTTDELRWDELPAELPPIDAAQRAAILAVLAEATARRKMFATLTPLGINAGSLYRPIVNLAREVLSPEQRDFSWRFVYSERVRHLARRTFAPRLYKTPAAAEPYVFFPLHVIGDTALTIRAPQFQNQEYLVEMLAQRCLPTGMKLYVKPHPAGRFNYPLPMLARIRALRGVRLLDPAVNSHQVIEASRAVVVINSTAGFESLFYRKPVVTVGRIFYRGFGVTRDVDYLGDLPEAVRLALESPVDEERILRFLHACWSVTFPVTWADDSDENLKRLSVEVIAKAARLTSAAPRSPDPTSNPASNPTSDPTRPSA